VLTAEPLNLASLATVEASIVDVTPFLIFCIVFIYSQSEIQPHFIIVLYTLSQK
jgi:hypothetical protein